MTTTPLLRSYDAIEVSTSGGKDSQVMLDVICERARAEGVLDRVVAVHCDLGEVEWPGTRELAEEQARAYSVSRFIVVSRPQGDLLTQIEQRGLWPSSAARYCTSDHKRAQVRKVFTQLSAEVRAATGKPQARILNCLGLRAEESPARKNCPECKGFSKSKSAVKRAARAAQVAACLRCEGSGERKAFEFDAESSNGRRHVDLHLPIHDWTKEQVWTRIRASGVRYHPVYDQGMGRLSCSFCVLAPEAALVRAAQLRPDMAEKYATLEDRLRERGAKLWRFTNQISIRDVTTKARALPVLQPTEAPLDWCAGY